MIEFDIVIPIYNVAEDFLRPCLDSVKNQTNQNWNAWIVDSTPESHELMLNDYLSDTRFHRVLQDPQGISAARNEGMMQGNAPFIAFLDGDDYWYETHLEWMEEVIEDDSSRTALWFTAADSEITLTFLKSGETHTTTGVANHHADFNNLRPEDSYWFIWGNPPMLSNSVVRRSRYLESGGFDTKLTIGEDTEFVLRLCGDPRKNGGESVCSIQQINAVSGYHSVGVHQTTKSGTQSPRTATLTPKEATARLSIEQRWFSENHPPISEDDRPGSVSDEYWNWLKTKSMSPFATFDLLESNNR